ncbi:MAG: outer membrane beta-barrel protein [Sphingobacteriales bacterium]
MKKLNRVLGILAVILFLSCPVILQAQNKPDTATFTKAYSDKFKSNLSVGAGIHINNISPSKTSPYYIAGGRAYTSVLPEISFGTSVFTDPATARVVFRLEFSLTDSRYRANYQSQVEPYVPMKVSFDQIGYVLMPQALYNIYNADDLKIYLGLGVALQLFQYSNVYYGVQNPAQSNAVYGYNTFDLNKFDDTIVIKAGARIGKHWGVYANYVGNTYTTQVGYFTMASYCKQVGVNYFFN